MPIVADREDDDILICAGDTIRRSIDRGESWTTVVEARSFGLAQAPDAAIYAGGVPFLRSVDHGATFEPYGDLSCEAWQVAADPHQAGRVSAACPDDGFYTTDDGTTWRRIDLDAPAGHAYSALVFDPMAPGHLAATLNQEGELGLAAQVMISTDAGESWLVVTPELECAFAPAILYLSDAAGHLVVGTQSADHYCPSIAGQLLESTDNGATWYDVTANLWPPQVHVGGLFEGPDGDLFVSTWDGGVCRRDPR